MKTLILALAMSVACCTSFGQDWIEEKPEDWLGPLQTQQASMQQLLDELHTVMDEVKAATAAANEAASDARAAANEARALRTSNMTEIDSILAELKARPSFTEEEIRAFAREEAQKLVATVKMPDGTSKEVKASEVVPVAENKNNTVSVVGYAGTFEVPVGGYITHIDGKPVTRAVLSAPVQATRVVGTVAVAGVTEDYQVHATRGIGNRVKFFAAPRATVCRIVNGVQVCN
jgi:hypothetical protein